MKDDTATGERQGEGGIDALAVLQSLPDPVVVIDDTAHLVWGNTVAEELFGLGLDEARGASVDRFVHRDDLVTALVSLTSVQEKRIGTPVTIRVRDRSGDYRLVEIRGRTALDVPGVHGVVLVLRDITDRHLWAVDHGDPALLGAIVDHAATVTMVLDAEGRIRGAARAFTRLLGRPIETTLGRRLSEFTTADAATALDAELALAAATPGSRTFEAALLTVDDVAVWTAVSVVNLLDDRAVQGLVVTAVDITELVTARRRLEHLATHDELTGVLNRAALHDHLAGVLRAASDERPVTIVFCDLDGFKVVNDSFGHQAGDAALAIVARRLLAAVRPGDLVGRIGGDEFVLVLRDDDGDRAVGIVRRLEVAMSHPVALAAGRAVRVQMSAGVVVSTGEADAGAVLERADSAMYEAKRARTGVLSS